MVKDLNILGRDLSQTIIVDNSIHAFGYHLNNGIPIPSFYGQNWDTELEILVRFIESINDHLDGDTCRTNKDRRRCKRENRVNLLNSVKNL